LGQVGGVRNAVNRIVTLSEGGAAKMHALGQILSGSAQSEAKTSLAAPPPAQEAKSRPRKIHLAVCTDLPRTFASQNYLY
jgi:hypothetical protein